LASAANVSARAISDLERGFTRTPQAGTVRRLADTLGLNAAERAEFEQAPRQAPPAQRARLEPAAAASLPAPARISRSRSCSTRSPRRSNRTRPSPR
jgi:transcriptional regulator with XRE-family HTH domain